MGFLEDYCLFQEFTDDKIANCKPFYCGNNDLDEFFHEDVTKFSYYLMGKSYCFVLEDDTKTIVSAFTVSNDSIRAYDLPRSRHDYMKHLTHKHMRRYPGVLVGRLAVNKDFAHKGVGSEVLQFIKQWFLFPDNKTGCRFVVVDAVNESGVLRFYRKNGFVCLFTSEEQEFLYTGGKKDEPIVLPTRLMYFDLMEMSSLQS